MRIFYCDHFVLPLPPGHRFPMEKYARLRERVREAGLGGPGSLRVPEAVTDAELERVHHPGYVRKVVEGRLGEAEVRGIGFPWSPGLVERSRRSVGGTLEAARAALDDGAGVNLAGGTHHAFPDRGLGFCVFNDVAVAARAVQAEGLARRITVVDLDVHQGDGTAHIFRDDPSVFTLSVHGANNFPFQKERSDLDVALPDGTGDETYLDAVGSAVEEALERARPGLVFYVAGADPFHGDKLGRLAVTEKGMARRDALVFEACRKAGAGVAVVMSGGYAPEIARTVEIHFRTVALAAEHVAHLAAP